MKNVKCTCAQLAQKLACQTEGLDNAIVLRRPPFISGKTKKKRRQKALLCFDKILGAKEAKKQLEQVLKYLQGELQKSRRIKRQTEK